MPNFAAIGRTLAKWGKTLGAPVLVSAIVSAAISGVAAYLVQSNLQINTTRMERAFKFSVEADQLHATGGQLVLLIKNGEELDKIKTRLRNEIARQHSAAEELRIIFPSMYHEQINRYQAALEAFAHELPSANSPTTMRAYAEGFNQVFVSKLSLTKALLGDIGGSS